MVKQEVKENLNYVFIDDFQGQKTRLKLFENSKQDENKQIKLVWFQYSANMEYGFFCFRSYNRPKSQNVTNADGVSDQEIKKNYFFIRKSANEMKEVLSDENKALFNVNDKVLHFLGLNKFKTVWIGEIFDLTDEHMNNIMENDIDDHIDDENEHLCEETHLTFPTEIPTYKDASNLFVFIY